MSLVELLFPPRCISCGLSGISLCSLCEAPWRSSVQRFTVGGLPVFSSAPYLQSTSSIILAAKEDGNRAAQKILATALERSLDCALATMKVGLDQIIYLVPIPSSRKNIRRRGFIHLAQVLRQLTKPSPPLIEVRHLLEVDRAIADQSELDRQERWKNISGSYRLTPGWERWAEITGGGVILLDDLVTTGSSLREAVRALKVAKISPECAISACAVGASQPIR